MPEQDGGTGDRPITVLVVDDHRAFSDALNIAIDIQPDLECVGVAATLSDAVRIAAERQPDVVLLDVHLPDADGVEGTARLREVAPRCNVVILTGDTNPATMARAAAAGAAGFLVKAGPMTEVLEGIRTAREGGMLIRGATLSSILEQLKAQERLERRREGKAALTSRELEVLALLGRGQDPATIARDLGISIHTARGHVKSILAKLDVHSQLEAVVAASGLGLLSGHQA